MDWVPIALAAWVLISVPIAVVIGRAIHGAQQSAGRGTVRSLRAGPRTMDTGPSAVRLAPPEAPLRSEEPPLGNVLVRTLATDDERTRGDDDESHGGTHRR